MFLICRVAKTQTQKYISIITHSFVLPVILAKLVRNVRRLHTQLIAHIDKYTSTVSDNLDSGYHACIIWFAIHASRDLQSSCVISCPAFKTTWIWDRLSRCNVHGKVALGGLFCIRSRVMFLSLCHIFLSPITPSLAPLIPIIFLNYPLILWTKSSLFNVMALNAPNGTGFGKGFVTSTCKCLIA